ncbi:hypothetical protein ABT56_19500 [Photobacterium aquae]|uniref:AraC-type arabinose-binding/dimerisation domain-containing protein n=1 Tax=Photobacterium aquae TaxID=1195763 RepID=A0A0J1JMG0_9GAMM|nr:hypothetical protein [Photobacterium aquae]KLV03317.1 hypothetical protein ABT56_19500 [Photobacterium aquae]
MKQAIDFSHIQQTFLDVGSRRKSQCSYMLLVTKGCAFIRLGKNEFAVKAGGGFYIPFDCLHAVTVLPGSEYYKVSFSARLLAAANHQPQLCRDAGYFNATPLITAVCSELATLARKGNELAMAGKTGNLLRVLADQIYGMKVHTKSTSPGLAKHDEEKLAKLLSGDTITDIDSVCEYLGFTHNELVSCLLMREAIKLSRSGRKAGQIAQSLNTPVELLSAMAEPILGKPLSQA